MAKPLINLRKIKTVKTLMKKAKKLEGKTLYEIQEKIRDSDPHSRVHTKGRVGHFIERWVFGVKKNTDAKPDIAKFDIEIKTLPLKYNKSRTKISVKEPLSLNLINYNDEVDNLSLKESSMYKKNKKILFVSYLHDREKERSEYKIIKVFLWEIDKDVIEELEPDYNLIVGKIRQGKAHKIHQGEHEYLTICPKHSGKFKDPNDTKSKRTQPFSDEPAEIRAFRLKTKYMNLIMNRRFNKKESTKPWEAKEFL